MTLFAASILSACTALAMAVVFIGLLTARMVRTAEVLAWVAFIAAHAMAVHRTGAFYGGIPVELVLITSSMLVIGLVSGRRFLK